MTVQEFYDYCKEHGYLDYQMTTYDFDRYTEEVMFKPYNELYTPLSRGMWRRTDYRRKLK